MPHLQPEQDAFGTVTYLLLDLIRRAMEKIWWKRKVFVVTFSAVSLERFDGRWNSLVVSGFVKIV